MSENEIDINAEALCAVDSTFWADYRGLYLNDSVRYTLKGHPYLADLASIDKKVLNIIKGSQVGATTVWIVDAFHACKYRKYDKNIIYAMPTKQQVLNMCKVSFDPIINYNSEIHSLCSTNNSEIKTINGRSIIFIGMQVSAAGSTQDKESLSGRSYPCDCIYRDEYDWIDEGASYQLKQRLRKSRFGREVNFGTPTTPEVGIDKQYKLSDQGKWQIKCRGCGKHTCVESDFPDSIILEDGRWRFACKHCNAEIYVIDGNWELDAPDAKEAGRWISSFLSPEADLDELMWQYHHTDGTKHCEFLKSALGIASADVETRVTKEMVFARCGNEPVIERSSTPTIMGVDVGKKLHTVVGIRTARDQYKVLAIKELEDFDELYDYAGRMNVKHCVIDSRPDYHAAKSFQKHAPFRVWLSDYNTSPTSGTMWKSDGIAKVNRTEWCDKVHAVFTKEGQILLPRNCNAIQKYAHQMTMTYKCLEEQPNTGMIVPKWKKAGDDDHGFHATVYFLLAASKAPISNSGRRVPTKVISNYKLKG